MYNFFVIALINLILGIFSLLVFLLLIAGIITTILYWPAFEVPAIFWAAFAVAVVICFLCQRFFSALNKKARSVLREINNKENLSLSGQHLLGYPSTKFVAFDQHNRKLAFCHISGTYKIYDFSYILRWDFTWKETAKVDENLGTYKIRKKRKRYRLHLHTANLDHPILEYKMEHEKEANEWDARLNAIFNG